MDLSLFFNALPEEMSVSTESYSDLYYAADIFCNSFPKIPSNSVSFIGLPDSSDPDDPWRMSDRFRHHFYSLKRTARTVLFQDLGNLRMGANDEETRTRIAEVCSAVVEMGSVPVLLGGSREFILAQFAAHKHTEDDLNIANIDSTLDLDHEDGVLHKVVTMTSHLPTHFCQIGYQSYLVDPMGIAVMERLNFESCRLGQIHEDFRVTEPLIRDADVLFFNLSAIRHSAFANAPGARPFGLNGEQACQMCWYAGTSPRLKSLGFFNILPSAVDSDVDMLTLSIMVWHFLEGFGYRQNENPRGGAAFEKYHVAFTGTEDLHFYHSRMTDRWWVEVPKADGKEGYLLPCQYQEYLQAQNGYIPDRWVRTFGRLN